MNRTLLTLFTVVGGITVFFVWLCGDDDVLDVTKPPRGQR